MIWLLGQDFLGWLRLHFIVVRRMTIVVVLNIALNPSNNKNTEELTPLHKPYVNYLARSMHQVASDANDDWPMVWRHFVLNSSTLLVRCLVSHQWTRFSCKVCHIRSNLIVLSLQKLDLRCSNLATQLSASIRCFWTASWNCINLRHGN